MDNVVRGHTATLRVENSFRVRSEEPCVRVKDTHVCSPHLCMWVLTCPPPCL